jgi:hypothetical protein
MTDTKLFCFDVNYTPVNQSVISLNLELIPGSNDVKSAIMTKSFIQIRNAELNILDKLVTTDDVLIDEATGDAVENEDGTGIVMVDKQLPKETSQDIDLIMSQLLQEGNILVPQLQLLRQQCPNTFTFRTTHDTIGNLRDVFGLDAYFITDESISHLGDSKDDSLKRLGVKSHCLVCVSGSDYYGCVWLFERPEYPQFIGIYGIRGSILNLLVSKCSTSRRGVATTLIEGVQNFGKMGGKTKVVVPWPLRPMVPILNKLGFTEVNTSDNTLERLFLEPVASTSNYFTRDL